MDPFQIILCSLGAILIVIGVIKLPRKKRWVWPILLPGIAIFLLGCLFLSK
jgi:hypothetical protein